MTIEIHPSVAVVLVHLVYILLVQKNDDLVTHLTCIREDLHVIFSQPEVLCFSIFSRLLQLLQKLIKVFLKNKENTTQIIKP